jgi:hypothetical protein
VAAAARRSPRAARALLAGDALDAGDVLWMRPREAEPPDELLGVRLDHDVAFGDVVP